MISIKQLTYALAAQKTLHFKKAAEHCNISQSALSTAVSDLENELGLQIFERDNRKVLVTPMGEAVLTQAQNILLQIEALQGFANAQKSPLSFPLTVGIIPTIAPYLIPKILLVLNEAYPGTELVIVEEQSHLLVEQVQRGEIDTAILALPYPCEGLLSMTFWEEDFYWVALKEAKYSKQREISAQELRMCNLMLLKDGHCLKDHIIDVCNVNKQTANHGIGASSLHTLIQMVLGGLGTTLIPEMAREQLISQHKGLTAIHVNEPSPHRKIAFIIRPNYTRMSSIEALMKVCKTALNQ